MEKDNNQNVVPSNMEPKDKEKTNETVPEFTPEQQDYIDRIVSGIKNENKQKLEEVTKDNSKKINDEVQKQLEERERRAKMSAEEKAADDLKKLQEQNNRLAEQLEKRERIDFGRSIAEKYNIPSTMVTRLIGSTNEETEQLMKSFADDYTKAVQAGIDKRLAGTQQPQTGSTVSVDDTKKLSELSLDEQTKLYKENPSLYNQLASR